MKVPARLAGVPVVLLEDARRRCDGDWDRVTYEGGWITVHNHPVILEAPKKKAPAKKAAPRKRAVPRKKETAKPKPVPAPQPEPQPLKVLETPATKAAKPELFREPAPVVQESTLRKYDRELPPEFQVAAAWAQLNVDHVATALLNRCRNGLPDVLPLDMHPEVLALEGINFEIVKASVRHPSYVEIAGMDTKEKGYPILRFYRGDVMTVVGMRDVQVPIVIATYATSRLDPDQHRAGTMKGTGGGGARRRAGLPGTPKAVVTRLRSMGADCLLDELHDTPVSVTYRGQDLGKVPAKGSKADCESAYQRIVRKMEAISRR